MKNNKFLHVGCLSLALLMSATTIVSCGNKTGGNSNTSDSVTSETSESSDPGATNITPQGTDVPNANYKHKLIIHYRRADATYDEWNIWFWPSGGEGKAIEFGGVDAFGAFAEIDLDDYSGATSFGFIVRKGDWVEKDYDGDIVFDLDKFNPDGDNVWDVYNFSGKPNIFASLDDTQKSVIDNSYFAKDRPNSIYTYYTKSTKDGGIYKEHVKLYMLYKGQRIKLDTTYVSVNPQYIFLTFNEDEVRYDANYEVEIEFTSGTQTKTVSKTNLYDSKIFYDKYTYYGDDLGVTFSESKTTTNFKLWAPISQSVTLNIYANGTPKSENATLGSDDISKKYELKYDQQGVWGVSVSENLHGKYYTYTINNGDGDVEVVDPYAKSCGINGKRGMIVDFDEVDKEIGWDNVKRPENIKKATDQSIYEMHINDMTISETSGLKNITFDQKELTADKLRGKFLGLAQKGTTYTKDDVTVKTGLDHIKELGVNTVQIQPLYDYNSIDEKNPNGKYNWGYDPLNYNCLEGSYSTDPYDGLSRVKEFKQMMKAFSEEGINVNMDVVFNHTAGSDDTNFEKIIPGYYHRRNADGGYSNGSGCGNEMASEKPMVRKFVVDSCKFWMDTYKLSGYRFDLMKLLDVKTMQEVYNECSKIYPNCTVYGEPWTGGTSTNTYTGADQTTIIGVNGVGAFNDQFRDGVKGGSYGSEYSYQSGNTYVKKSGARPSGWIHDGKTGTDKVINGIKGTFSGGKMSPSKVINYVSAHDNYCITDFLKFSANSTNFEMKQTQTAALTILAEGVPFIYEGDEFMRSKDILNKGLELSDKSFSLESSTIAYNSYKFADYNTIDYSDKVDNFEVFNVYKDLYKVRNEHAGLRLGTRSDVDSSLTMVSTGKFISYKIITDEEELYIVHAQEGGAYDLGNTYTMIFNNKDGAANTELASYTFGANETAVFVAKK